LFETGSMCLRTSLRPNAHSLTAKLSTGINSTDAGNTDFD